MNRIDAAMVMLLCIIVLGSILVGSDSCDSAEDLFGPSFDVR